MCRESKAAGAAKFKFISTLMGNIYIETAFMQAFIMTFGLHEKTILDRPLIVRCDIAIDAEDLPLIFRIACRRQTPEDFPDGVQGMVQIKSFTALDANVAMDARRWKIWEEAKTKNHLLDRALPVGKNAAGLIDFHMEGTDQVLTYPLHILDGAIDITAKMALGKDVVYPITGQTVHMNFTDMVHIGFVNFNSLVKLA